MKIIVEKEQWTKNITHRVSLEAQWHTKRNKETKEATKGIKCLENKNKNFIEFIYFAQENNFAASQQLQSNFSQLKLLLTSCDKISVFWDISGSLPSVILFFMCDLFSQKSQNKKKLSNGLSYRPENWVFSFSFFFKLRLTLELRFSSLYFNDILLLRLDTERKIECDKFNLDKRVLPSQFLMKIESKPHTSWRHKNNNFICSISRKEIPFRWVTSRNFVFLSLKKKAKEDQEMSRPKCIQWKIYVRFHSHCFVMRAISHRRKINFS